MSEIKRMIIDAKGATFKISVPEGKSLDELLEEFGLKEIEGIDPQFEDSEKGLLLVIKALNTGAGLKIFDIVWENPELRSKTDIYYPKPNEAAK